MPQLHGGEDGKIERRKTPWLSEEQIEQIAQRAAEINEQKIYVEIGKSAVRAFLYVVGSATIIFLAWFGITGKLPIPPSPK